MLSYTKLKLKSKLSGTLQKHRISRYAKGFVKIDHWHLYHYAILTKYISSQNDYFSFCFYTLFVLRFCFSYEVSFNYVL